MAPRYQHFHPLAASQFEQLKKDIEQKGVLVPIIVDENDKVIDGHQRRAVCAELHIECPKTVMAGLSEDEKHILSIVLNVFRRHLTASERQPALAELAQLGWSSRRIAEAVGVSHQTVSRALKSGGPSGPPANVDPETGEITDGAVPDDPGASRRHALSEGPERATSTAPSVPTERKVTGKDGKTYPVKPAPTRREKPPTALEVVERFGKGIVAWSDRIAVHNPEQAVAAFVETQQAERIEEFVGQIRKYADALDSALKSSKKLKAV